MKLTLKQIEAAVAWWQQALRSPKFDTLGKTRNDPAADPGHVVALAELMADDMAAKNTIPEATLNEFGHYLRLTLSEKRPNEHDFELSVDYHPNRELSRCAESVGISASGLSTFPWKTWMTFKAGGVQVSCGYGAPEKELVSP